MNAAVSARLREDSMRPLLHAGKGYYAFVGFLIIIAGWGVFAYSRQLTDGLVVTGMRDKVSWGLYITNFVFFIGISHAGTLISAILRVTNAEWRRPITRMAEVITVVALMTGALFPIIDLGRPDRIPNLILHGQLGSPIVWDLISIGTYLTGSIIYLYLPMIPDLAMCRDRFRGSAHRFQARLYSLLALGWRNTAEQRRRLDIALAVMMVLIIPIAVSVHTVVSWIFAMTLRSGWNSTVFGPYFVVGAIFSGVAAIITVMWIFRKVYHLESYITEQHFRYLGFLLLALDVIYLYFTLAEYLTTGYKLAGGDKALLEELMLGRYAGFFWAFVVGGTIVPGFLVALPQTRTVRGIFIASILVNIGMWLKRFVIVIPSMALPLMPYEWGVYWPTWVEISITIGSLAWFALLFALFTRFFPIISVWEVEEGLEHAAAAVPVQRPVPALAHAATVGAGPASASTTEKRPAKRRMRFGLALGAVALVAAFALGVATARAHGEPQITVRPPSAMPGDTLAIEGEGFEAGSEVALALVTVGGESELGMVTADEEGVFRFELTVEKGMEPGSVEVHAQSGEAHAVARFTVSGAAGGETVGTAATRLTVTGEQEEDGHVLFMATLTDAQGEPVPAAPVVFLIDAELLDVTGRVPVAEAATDVNGLATAEYTPTFDGEIEAFARFEGVGFYKPSEAGTTFEVTEYQPAYTVEGRGLEALRQWAPVGLTLVVLGVWFVFAFVAYQIYRIARAGGAA